jgi:dUTP pyrophosphatase
LSPVPREPRRHKRFRNEKRVEGLRKVVHELPNVEVRILDERVREWGLPRYHSEMAAGVDLFACVEECTDLEAQAPALLVPSGISVHIGDPGFVGLVLPRSGLGHRSGLVLGNLVGVIDADYNGPLLVSVWNRSALGSLPVRIEPGDRIAQLLFVPVARPMLAFVETFSKDSERGDGGFGSTGSSVTPGKTPRV